MMNIADSRTCPRMEWIGLRIPGVGDNDKCRRNVYGGCGFQRLNRDCSAMTFNNSMHN